MWYWDYGYVEYIRKAVENGASKQATCTNPRCRLSATTINANFQCTNNSCRMQHMYELVLQNSEIERDFFAGSLKEIKYLVQFDEEPNYDLQSARLEIYKISISSSESPDSPSFSK